jgi:DNA repair protein RecN (Recombination protein N)
LLRELHISNLAVIEDLTVEFDSGLNVFTGQTGAGKSLILGAFEALLGLRKAGDLLREGAEQARIAGVFEVHGALLAEQLSETIDQAIAPGEQVLITRKLHRSGRSSVTINGEPATATMAREAGRLLVDIHGQHDHQLLLKPANQLNILDGFAEATALRDQFAEQYHHWQQLHQQKSELGTSQSLRQQQLELYEFQAQEIDGVDPRAGELPELQARHALLSNMQQIQSQAGQVHSALYEADGAITERLEMAVHMLRELAELDETIQPMAEQLREAATTVRETAFDLGRYVDRLEHDPNELEEVETRLNSLNRLVKKYAANALGEDPAAAVIEHRQKIGEEIERLRGQDDQLADLDRQLDEAHQQLRALGEQLSEQRRQAIEQLVPIVEPQLKELGMGEAKFDIQRQTVDLDAEEAGPSGLDRVDMLVQTNPGQGFKPLRKIASGGELSRIMLAVKSVLASSDRVSVLVFDEIDANIGGRLGSVIGRKMQTLAKGLPPTEAMAADNGAASAASGRSKKKTKRAAGEASKKKPAAKKQKQQTTDASDHHQVLCITHLPQIAAFADRHFRIVKDVTGEGQDKTTRTSVSPLEGTHRIEELAEMMAGQEATKTTRQQAQELLEAATG